MLPRAGPRVPSRSRSPARSPARPGRPGAPPAARPCRRTGGRDRLLLRKFQECCGPQLQTASSRLLWRWASEDYEKGYDVIRCEIKKKPLLLEYGEQIEIGSEM